MIRTIKDFIISLLCLYFFLIPLEYFFSTSAGTILRYLGLLIGFVIIPHIWLTRPKLSLPVFILLIWLLMNLLSIFWVSAEYYWIDAIPVLLRNVLFIVMVSFLVLSENDYIKLSNSYLIGATIMSAYTLYYSSHYLNGLFVERSIIYINGRRFDPNYLAALLVYPISTVLFKILNTKNKQISLQILSFVLMVLAALSTGSRGGFISIIFVIIFTLFFTKRKKGNIRFLLSTLLVIGILIFGINILGDDLTSRFALDSLIGKVDQGAGRLMIWKNSFSALMDKPLIGYGTGNVYYANSIYGFSALGAHNMFLSIAVELGIIGLTLFLLFLTVLWYKLFKINARMELSSFFGLMVSCMFLDSLTAKFLWGTILIFVLKNNVRNDQIYVRNIING